MRALETDNKTPRNNKSWKDQHWRRFVAEEMSFNCSSWHWRTCWCFRSFSSFTTDWTWSLAMNKHCHCWTNVTPSTLTKAWLPSAPNILGFPPTRQETGMTKNWNKILTFSAQSPSPGSLPAIRRYCTPICLSFLNGCVSTIFSRSHVSSLTSEANCSEKKKSRLQGHSGCAFQNCRNSFAGHEFSWKGQWQVSSLAHWLTQCQPCGEWVGSDAVEYVQIWKLFIFAQLNTKQIDTYRIYTCTFCLRFVLVGNPSASSSSFQTTKVCSFGHSSTSTFPQTFVTKKPKLYLEHYNTLTTERRPEQKIGLAVKSEHQNQSHHP